MIKAALLPLTTVRAVEETAGLLLVDLLVRGALATTLMITVAGIPRIPVIIVVVGLALVRVAALLVQFRANQILNRRFRQARGGWLRRGWHRGHHVIHLHMHELRRQLNSLAQFLAFTEVLHPLASDRQVRALSRFKRHLHGWRRVENMLADMAPVYVDLLQADPRAIRVQLEPCKVFTHQIQLQATSPRLEIDVLHPLVVRRDPHSLSIVVSEDLLPLRLAAPHMGWVTRFRGLGVHASQVVDHVLLPLHIADQPAQGIDIWRLPLSIDATVLCFECLAGGLLIRRANLDRMALRFCGQDAVDGLPHGIQMAADERLLRRAVLLLEARSPKQEFNLSHLAKEREQFSLKGKTMFFS